MTRFSTRLGLLFLAGCCCSAGDSSYAPLGSFDLDCETQASWKQEAENPFPGERAADHHLDIYIDASSPMGGFLPVNVEPGVVSTIDLLADDLPNEVLRAFGGDESKVRWFTFASRVNSLKSRPKFNQGVFSGGSSDVSEVLRRAAEDVSLGRSDAAVIVTDLVATGDVLGGGGAARALLSWLQSEEVRSGDLAVGVLGVRAPYWGTRAGSCRKNPGLGCWFSEQAEGWMPVTEVARVPVYAVVLGRGDGDAGPRMQGLLERVGSEISRHDNQDVASEVLTSAVALPDLSMSCQAGKDGRPQMALMADQERRFLCPQSDPVPIRCGPKVASGEKVVSVETKWPAASFEVADADVLVTVDCGAAKKAMPKDDLVLDLRVGPATHKDTWSEWSKRSDRLEADLGRTLFLEDFVDKLRIAPDELHVTCEPILRAR